jgi:hypothetical protein
MISGQTLRVCRARKPVALFPDQAARSLRRYRHDFHLFVENDSREWIELADPGRNAAGNLGRACGRGDRPAADAVVASCGSPGRHGSGQRRHVLRASLGTGFVGRAASENRGVASGTYLACYFLGGLVGSAVLGQLFDRFGWIACIAGVAASLAMAALLTAQLTRSGRGERP